MELSQAPGTREACVARAAEFDVSRSVARYRELYEGVLRAT
jgi:hypothetical protein